MIESDYHQPLLYFRWVDRDGTLVLQQKFQVSTDCNDTEWFDVPVEEE